MKLLALRKKRYHMLFVFLTAICLQSFAGRQNFTFLFKELPLSKAFEKIELYTGYSFIYTTETIKGIDAKITVAVSDGRIEDILKQCFSYITLEYTIQGRKIIVRKRSERLIVSDRVPANFPDSVRGRVLNEEGLPLNGASVTVEGSNIGTFTSADGRFVLASLSKKEILSVSFVGYETKKISIEGKKELLLQMEPSKSELDEVQMIAYGKVSRRFQTGNVSTVKAVDIEKQPVTNPLLALQGRVPGLDIIQTSGLPGGGVTLSLQGVNSITGGSDPLYIIDGVPYSSQLLPIGLNGGVLGNSGSGGGNLGSAAGNPLNYLNPADIESIDVLKDADATAIYGSRAANGAILITTKKGKVGQIKVALNVQNGWSKMAHKLPLLNSQQYVAMRKEAFKNDNILTTNANAYDIKNLYGWDTSRTMDWQKILLGGTALYFNTQADFSGGNASTQYLVGIGYNRQTTITPGDYSDRKGSLHYNVNSTSANQRFKMQFSGNMMVDDNRLQTVDLVGTALSLSPTAPDLYMADGTLNWAPDIAGNTTWAAGRNPLAYLNAGYKNKTYNFITNSLFSYRVWQDLEAKVNVGYTFLQSDQLLTTPLSVYQPELRRFLQRSTTYSNNKIKSWIVEPQLSYDKELGGGKMQVLIGTTLLQNNKEGANVVGSGYVSDALMEDLRSALTLSSTASVYALYKYNALFGRINYNLLNRYIINLTARRDGSSSFGPQNRFHNFGAIGMAWIFSEEPFMKKHSFMSFGKLKYSYGTTGNDQIGDYTFLDLYSANTGQIPYQNVTSLAVKRLFNPLLQWEETKKLSVGVDLGFVKDRVLLSVTYARNRSGNQLGSYPLPITTGFTSITANVNALVQNTVWELMLTGYPIKSKDFQWGVNVNLTVPRNKLLSWEDFSKSPFFYSKIIGEPIIGVKLFHYTGMDVATGKPVFEDSKGNMTMSPDFSKDQFIYKSLSLRKWYGGISNTVHYKHWQFDCLFQLVNGNQQAYFSSPNNPGFYRVNQPITVLDRWQKPGDRALMPRFSTFPQFAGSFQSSDGTFVDCFFVRLKNISLSWSLPEGWLKKVRLQQVRLFASGQNICFWATSKYVGLDPETGSAAVPPLRTIAAGVKIEL